MTTTFLNQTIVPDATNAFFPSELYLLIAIVAIILFIGALWVPRGMIVTSILSTFMFLFLAWVTPALGFNSVVSAGDGTEQVIANITYNPFIPYLLYFWMLMFFIGLFVVIYIVYNAMMVASRAKQSEQEWEDNLYRERHLRRMGGQL